MQKIPRRKIFFAVCILVITFALTVFFMERAYRYSGKPGTQLSEEQKKKNLDTTLLIGIIASF